MTGHAQYHKDYTGAKIGMWLFLFTEIILFGGLFIIYSVFRSRFPHEFHAAGGELNVVLGVTNTVVLLTSSLTMALSISALQQARARQSALFLSATILMGFLFLVNKYFEWSAKIHHGLYPGSAHLLERAPGERLFFGLYYTMTGLHGIHVVAGIVLLSIMLALLLKGRIRPDDFVKLENSGLYWHLVDVIWIFLLPLFYLAA
jgi:cytochrome c oxidase subunit 3